MGVYGSPELLPNDNHSNNSNNKSSILRTIFIIFGSIFCGILTLIMITIAVQDFIPIVKNTNAIYVIGIILSFTYPVICVLFFIEFAHREKVFKYVFTSIVIVISFLIFLGSENNLVRDYVTYDEFFNSGNTYTIATDDDYEEPEQHELTLDEYKPMCTNYTYKEVARNPNDYIGQDAVFTGQVIQVQESGDYVAMRINVTKDPDLDIWEDTIYAEYMRKSPNESRILEDDIVNVYGTLNGIKTYTSVLGQEISIPYILVKFVEISGI